ncbi:MAG TPA: selenium metabolism-associated LysR family transcriptional regulator [Dissulfurispiraceae bacterium]|nr:selenium metabolism-associated LysR family transcriptional regulator [Dissulfurispiraceae bacterium]
MEDHKLKVFCTVAETKSFSKTSEIIHLTQPAVSLQIQALEEVYETKLFDRSSGTINLTPSGEILYKYAKEILALYAKAEKDIGKITGLIKGSIKIGTGTTVGNYILPSVIVDFKKTHPKIKIHVVIGNTKRIVELLNAGVIDFAILGDVKPSSKLIIEPMVTDELFIIAPPFHPWAKKKVISIVEMAKEPCVLREEGSATREIVERYFSEHGFSLNDMAVALILGSIGSVKEAVERGMGISIASKWAIRKEVKNGTLKMLVPKEGRIQRKFSLILPKNQVQTHAVDEFISYLRAYPYENLSLDCKP